MARNNNGSYSYTDAGFNGFMQRSIASNVNIGTLGQSKRNSSSNNSLNFDNLQVSGNLGDTIEVGNILIDGSVGDGRIDGRDKNGTPTWRLGDIES